MATLKTNWMIASITSVILLFGSFTANANETEKPKAKEDKLEVAMTPHFYNGPAAATQADLLNPENWNEEQDDNFSCGTSSSIPCSLPVPNDQSVSDYLQQLGSRNNIIAASETGRTT